MRKKQAKLSCWSIADITTYNWATKCAANTGLANKSPLQPIGKSDIAGGKFVFSASGASVAAIGIDRHL